MTSTSSDDARLAAAAALRSLNHAFVAHERGAEGLKELRAAVDAQIAAMELGERRDRLALIRAAAAAAGDEGGKFVPERPGSGFQDRAVAGRANPTSLDFAGDFSVDGSGDIVATVTLRRAFEGAPGRAHGGIVAAAFDDVTGYVIGGLREPAFTGELTVRFLAPVPVDEELVIRTRLESRERRKLFITAEMLAADAVIATCKAIYITVDPSIFAGAPDPR